MYNTIILLHGTAYLTKTEWGKFKKGDTIYGEDQTPKELKRWPIEQREAALEELAKYRCEYRELTEDIGIEEYALEFCETDDDGEFVCGSDYHLAEETE